MKDATGGIPDAVFFALLGGVVAVVAYALYRLKGGGPMETEELIDSASPIEATHN